MSNSNLQSAGRLYFVDPNNMYNDLPNGIPHPYEDYCISVDLTIRFGNRNSCGHWGNQALKNDDAVWTFGSDRGTINFIGGTNGYLTTNFTDIESTNPKVNTNECLGIESINITYNSWYVPQVSIRFVDVRGASLMSQQEQGYVDTLREDMATGHHGNTKINGGSFFKALFSFPYPMFKLKVKGFYGREVTYNLAVEDFQGSFNADNGNFEVDVKFIGYMFGVYTDIPMNYLMISPYFEGECGSKYWESQKENGRFRYYNAAPFKTYPELVKDMALIGEQSEITNSSGVNLSDKKREAEARITALNRVKTAVNDFLSVPFDGGYGIGKGENGNIFLFGISKKYNRFNFNGKPLSKEYDAKAPYEALMREINNYNDRYTDSTLTPADLGNFKLGTGLDSQEIKVDLKGVGGVYGGSTLKFSFRNCSEETTKEWLDARIREKGYVSGDTIYAYTPLRDLNGMSNYALPQWLYDIDDKIEAAEKEAQDAQTEIQSNMNTVISQNLGFGVSVGNAFRMSFAHMETFINIFNEYLRRIHNRKGGSTRTLSTLGVNVANTDLPSNFGANTSVPPFTMFYEEVESNNGGNSSTNEKTGKKKVPMWIGDLPGNKNGLDEIELVNKLIDAARFYSTKMAEAEAIAEISKANQESAYTESQDYIPITIYDLTHTLTLNPYAYLNTVTEASQVWEALMFTFITRVFNWASSQYTNAYAESGDALEAIGKIEANNVFRAFPTILPGVRDFLNVHKGGNMTDFCNKMKNYFVEDSKDNSRKLYDKGFGYAKHYAVLSGNYLKYDWAKATYYEQEGNKRVSKNREVPVFPVCNDSPTLLNPGSVSISNEKFIYLDEPSTNDCDENAHNYKTLKSIETPMSSPGSKELAYKTNYLNTIGASSRLSNVTGTYEKKVLPTLTVPDFVVGFGNSAKQRDSEHAVVIVSSTWIATRHNKRGVRIPKEEEGNDKDFYVQSPAHIQIYNGTSFAYYQLYGHPIFYAQNEIADPKRRNLAKAFLFATGMVADLTNNENSNVKPFVMSLAEGAFMFKTKYEIENGQPLLQQDGEIAKDYRKTFSMGAGEPRSISPRYKDENINTFTTTGYDKVIGHTQTGEGLDEDLISLFEDWATNEFPALNDIFEIKLEGHRDYKGFKELVTQVASLKKEPTFDSVFGGKGAYDTDFYAGSETLHVKNSMAFDYQANKVSDKQKDILAHICKYVMMFDTSKIANDEIMLSVNSFSVATENFFKELCGIYEAQLDRESQDPPEDTGIQYDPQNDKDLKLSTYMTLKNLYDRWICMNTEENRWKLDGGAASEFSQFKFIDGFYRKIEQRVAVNFEHIGELAREMMASSNVTNDSTSNKYQGRSFYDFLASVCQKNQMMLLSLPMENEFTNPEGIVEMFDVKPYSRTDTRDTSCFVCLYSNKPSQHLEIKYDNDEYLYSSDGFNIANAQGKIYETDVLLPQLGDSDIDGYKIPAFGVTYGKQNQSIFKKINVNMQNPQVTEASIAATQFIASKGNEGPYKTALYGQDLYRIYSNYSYTCSVDMMGNAQIMPLTYFQLNNIPMFRGTYMIINIEHNIAAGDMTTKFTGVRMCRYDTPLVDDKGIFTDPFLATDYHDGGYGYLGAEGAGSGVDMERLRNAMNEVSPGEHKYTVTLKDLIWSNTRNKYNKNHPDDPVPFEPIGEEVTRLETLRDIIQGVEDAWVNYCASSPDEWFAKYDGIHVNCAYRCGRKNRAGKSVNSLVGSSCCPHPLGIAIDMCVCQYDTSKKNETTPAANYHNGSPIVSRKATQNVFFPFLWKYLCEKGIEWGQIIEEGSGEGRWIHFGYINCDLKSHSCEVKRFRDGSYFDKRTKKDGICDAATIERYPKGS